MEDPRKSKNEKSRQRAQQAHRKLPGELDDQERQRSLKEGFGEKELVAMYRYRTFIPKILTSTDVTIHNVSKESQGASQLLSARSDTLK